MPPGAHPYPNPHQALTKDFGEPLTHTHFSAEGEVEFKSILYIPKEAPYDLYQVRARASVRVRDKDGPVRPLPGQG